MKTICAFDNVACLVDTHLLPVFNAIPLQALVMVCAILASLILAYMWPK